MRTFFACLLSFILFTGVAQNKEYYLLVGTYTTDIQVYKFNTTAGNASFVSKISGTANPSYLAVTKDQKYVYAVNENHKEVPGEISAFSFDKKKGELSFINKTVTSGDDPCYVETDSTGKWLLAANYSSGSFSIFKTAEDGSVQPLIQNIEHQGYSVNFDRQSKPHVHCTVFSPDGKYVFVNDLGTDKVYQYKFDPNNAQQPLSEDATTFDVPDGSGPRHIIFHPNKQYAYLISELSGKVMVYGYKDGQLNELQTIQSDNTGGKEDKGSADIHITPNGQYLYTSNRGKANDITIYRVGSTGLLTELGHQSTLGIHPRNFTIDPTGKWLLVANRDTNNIVVFNIIKSTGMLSPTGVQIHMDKPVCLKMLSVQ